ncbi:acyloxyacyl hydrolase [Alistipes sp.]|uniref:acyloxyacyl hydrolase n=1 Tax=Alistipes sp. TaxID=1872444 RepID=UPI003AF1285A
MLLFFVVPAGAQPRQRAQPRRLSTADTLPAQPRQMRLTGDSLRTADYRLGFDDGYAAGYTAGFVDGRTASRRPERSRLIHQAGVSYRPEWVVPTNPFLAGDNRARKPIDLAQSFHLRYSFRFRPGSLPDRIYGGTYQGLGVARFAFGNKTELGNPVAVYLFQGARIARIGERLSLNYEWNFGLSFGWKPYDRETNPDNVMTGSKMNAYLNTDFYLLWKLTPRIDLNAGLVLTHFSNGNTKFPNAGLNSIGGQIGLTYNFGEPAGPLAGRTPRALRPAFNRHVSYDLTLFGSWCRKGVAFHDKQLASPHTYTVLGFNFAAMYNFGYKFRAGLSLDGVYDGSANIYTEDYISEYGGSDPGYTFYKPALNKQLALGTSLRTEFVMPYFTVGIGLGVNVLHKGGDLKAFYQMLTLKVAVTHSSYVHIGYCLRDFQTPNYLMLGIGFRFNNKYPRLR